MTTIIANDKFMIADHRATTLVHQEDNHDVFSTGPKTARLDSYSDCFHKISLIDHTKGSFKGVNGDPIMCFGVSGSTSDRARFISALYDIRDNDIEKRITLLRKHCQFKNMSVMFMDSKGGKIVAQFYGPNSRTNVLSPDVTRAIGSGCVFLKASGAIYNNELTMEELLFLAAYFDTGTGSSYSVYSVEENILYQNVIPSTEYIRKTAKSAFDKLKIFDKAPEQYFNVKNDNSDYII